MWLGFIDRGLSPADVLGRAIGDASGDVPGTTRSAFPKDTAAFRGAFGDAFADMLVAEANATRRLRDFGPKTWVYKGYGLFQYDLQHIRGDEAFFREKQWYALDACLAQLAPGGVLVLKETDVVPRWKHRLAKAQELVATRVVRVTKGATVEFTPIDALDASLRARGLEVRRRRADKGYLHPHALVVARRTA